jgi:hypothetical protein
MRSFVTYILCIIEDDMSNVCSTHGAEEECIQYFRGKARRKEPVERPLRRWEYDVKMDLREIEWGGMDWTDLVQIGTNGGPL